MGYHCQWPHRPCFSTNVPLVFHCRNVCSSITNQTLEQALDQTLAQMIAQPDQTLEQTLAQLDQTPRADASPQPNPNPKVTLKERRECQHIKQIKKTQRRPSASWASTRARNRAP